MLRVIAIMIMFLAILPVYVMFGAIAALVVTGLMLWACQAWFEDGNYVASCMAVLCLVFFAGLVG